MREKRPEYYFRFQNGLQIQNRHARKPICREILPQNGILRVFLAILSLRMCRNAQNTTSGFKMDFEFGTGMPKTFIWGNLPQNGVLRVFLAIFSLRMRTNAQNTTSGFKMDFAFGTGMSENLYVVKFCPKTSFLTRLRLILCFDNAYNGQNRDFTLIFMFSPQHLG